MYNLIKSLLVSTIYLIDIILYVFIFLITGGTQQRKLLITGLLKHIYKLTCMKSDIIKGTVIYDAVEYFKFYTRSIEISRKERVYKIYFYLMPFRGNYKEVNILVTN